MDPQALDMPDRGVLEEIDAVGEERDGADGQGHGELNAEVAEVERRHPAHDAP
jgi:hypothetical protein